MGTDVLQSQIRVPPGVALTRSLTWSQGGRRGGGACTDCPRPQPRPGGDRRKIKHCVQLCTGLAMVTGVDGAVTWRWQHESRGQVQGPVCRAQLRTVNRTSAVTGQGPVTRGRSGPAEASWGTQAPQTSIPVSAFGNSLGRVVVCAGAREASVPRVYGVSRPLVSHAAQLQTGHGNHLVYGYGTTGGKVNLPISCMETGGRPGHAAGSYQGRRYSLPP